QGGGGMRQVGQETEAVSALESRQHLYRTRDRPGILDERRKIGFDSHGNTRVVGMDVMAKPLQGRADPEPIVSFLAVLMRRLHELRGGSTIHGQKRLVGEGQAAVLQALGESSDRFFTP